MKWMRLYLGRGVVVDLFRFRRGWRNGQGNGLGQSRVAENNIDQAELHQRHKHETIPKRISYVRRVVSISVNSIVYIVQTDINASTAFRYETGGKDAWDLACCVDSVSKEVTPSVTRAGAASGLIQNETHCKMWCLLSYCLRSRTLHLPTL